MMPSGNLSMTERRASGDTPLHCDTLSALNDVRPWMMYLIETSVMLTHWLMFRLVRDWAFAQMLSTLLSVNKLTPERAAKVHPVELEYPIQARQADLPF